MNYSKKIIHTLGYALIIGFNTVYTSENITLTKSEVAKLKDYLTQTRDEAKQKVKEYENKITQMREQKMDLQSDAVKVVKDEKYRWQDIVDGNNKLLDQLRTGKYSYSLVVAQLKSLGTSPQDALQATGIRAKLLAGEKVHPLLIEIDAINPNKSADELDLAFKEYKIGKANDQRMSYILSDLLNRVLNKHREIMDQDGLRTGIAALEDWARIFQNDSKLAKVLKTRVIGDPAKRTKAYAIIDTIKKEHDL